MSARTRRTCRRNDPSPSSRLRMTLAREVRLRLARPIRRLVEREVVAPRGGNVEGNGAVPRRLGRVAQTPGALGGAGGKRGAVGAAHLRGARGERRGVVADQSDVGRGIESAALAQRFA